MLSDFIIQNSMPKKFQDITSSANTKDTDLVRAISFNSIVIEAEAFAATGLSQGGRAHSLVHQVEETVPAADDVRGP